MTYLQELQNDIEDATRQIRTMENNIDTCRMCNMDCTAMNKELRRLKDTRAVLREALKDHKRDMRGSYAGLAQASAAMQVGVR